MFPITEVIVSPVTPYSSTNDDRELFNLGDELPSYACPGVYGTASRERQLHEITLEGPYNRPWLSVRFHSWAPSPKSLPVFLEEQDISGVLGLDLQQPESIKCVEVSIRGFVRSGNDERDFLHISEVLWNSSFGEPRSPRPQTRSKYTEKLVGAYSWPFSITLPHEVPIEQKLARKLKLNRIERLPPSVHGLGWNSAINYRLTVKIKRHGMLRPDSSISTLVGYTPMMRPGAPSFARRRSYREGTPIPGPLFDPDGWRILRGVPVKGILFKQREVAVRYTLALATPLAYTRGTVIPCYLTVQSSDKQALDLLASPSAPRITLRRKLLARVMLEPVERVDLTALREGEAQPLSRTIWAPTERSGNECRLMGELGIPLGCAPSFRFGEFSLQYFIDVHAPAPAGFQPSNVNILSSTQIEVVSAYAEGCPRPRAYITPAHDASRRVAEADTLAESIGSLTLRRTASGSEATRSGSASGLGASSDTAFNPPLRFDTLRQELSVQDVRHSVSPNPPTGPRRLNRRFSAI